MVSVMKLFRLLRKDKFQAEIRPINVGFEKPTPRYCVVGFSKPMESRPPYQHFSLFLKKSKQLQCLSPFLIGTSGLKVR